MVSFILRRSSQVRTDADVMIVCSSRIVPVTQIVYWHPDDYQASIYIVGNDRTVKFQGYVLWRS